MRMLALVPALKRWAIINPREKENRESTPIVANSDNQIGVH
jgi:hypothetical protein